MTQTHKGSCLCGAVSFEVAAFDHPAGHCHCRMCRKFHGAEYATIVGVSRQSFRWIGGEDAIAEYQAPNGTVRSFCRHCGSSLFFQSPREDPAIIEVALAVFDEGVPVDPDAHIFMAYAADWTLITDDLPQFPEGRSAPAQVK